MKYSPNSSLNPRHVGELIHVRVFIVTPDSLAQIQSKLGKKFGLIAHHTGHSDLRLSDILDSLESRNRQAIESKLAYTDFLAMLIGDEVARREQKKFSMRLRRAQFRTTKTLEQFDFDRLPKLNRALVHDLATGRYLRERAPVLIVGSAGTGKSHLAQALGHCAIRQGFDVMFTTCTNLTQTHNAARGAGTYERKLLAMARVPLLVIDSC